MIAKIVAAVFGLSLDSRSVLRLILNRSLYIPSDLKLPPTPAYEPADRGKPHAKTVLKPVGYSLSGLRPNN